MRERGGRFGGLGTESDMALAGIVKSWGFVRHPLGNGAGWRAPPLAELRAAISRKYPAVEWDAGVTAWGQEPPAKGSSDEGAGHDLPF